MRMSFKKIFRWGLLALFTYGASIGALGAEGGTLYGFWESSSGRSQGGSGNRELLLVVDSDSQAVTIDLTSSADTYLYLTDINNNLLDQNDDGGTGYNSRLSRTLNSGTYRIIAATYGSGQKAEFTATVSRGYLKYRHSLETKNVSGLRWIYDDHDTGADSDVSVWRPDLSAHAGYFFLGDIAVGSHSAPSQALLIKGDGDLLASPVGFEWVWSDSGSGGSHDVSFWQPIAPAGYTCLGNIINSSIISGSGYAKPSVDVMRCIKSEYVLPGVATRIWTDAGSGADRDVGVWRVDAKDYKGLTVSAFVSRGSHGDSGGESFYRVLNKSAMQGLPSGPVTDWHAQNFAPRVYMHQEESYFPSSVEYHLDNTHDASGFLTTNQALGCDSCTDPAFLDGHRPDQTSVPVYAMVVPKTGTNITDVVYFMFYPYNNGKRVCVGLYIPVVGCVGGYSTFGNHVGDWEHLTLRFVDGIPSQIFLSQHSGGQTFNWGDSAILLEGLHPVVYSAKGSHGVYPDAARHTYKSLPNGDSLNDDTGAGVPWDTWHNVRVIQRQNQGDYSGDLSWLNYSGRWGNTKSGCTLVESVTGECVLNSGPTGPMDKNASNPGYMGLD